ncbi:MAG: TRAP transporter small permease [Chloroflexi bacterium]|nr:MAG: TRAP transporter small permease [Chloroflexota bacterium]
MGCEGAAALRRARHDGGRSDPRRDRESPPAGQERLGHLAHAHRRRRQARDGARVESPRAVIRRAADVAALLAGFATLAIVLLVSYDVLMRYFFDRPQLFVDEVASFLQVLVIFGGAAYTFRVGGHVRVDLITGILRPAVRGWLRLGTLLLGVVFLAVVIWVTTHSAYTAYSYGRVSAVMLYPLWLPMAFVPAGLALMELAMLVALVRQVKLALGPAARRDEVAPDQDG